MPITQALSSDQIARFKKDGFLCLRAEEWCKISEVQALIDWTTELQELPETPGKWMKYFETSDKDGSRILQRMENFFPYHRGMSDIFGNQSKVAQMVSELMGETAILYKEKINFKLPGGDGFEPHQDHAAGWWRHGHTYHVSVLVTIDEATVENGCLELVRGEHTKGLLGPEYKAVPEALVQKFKWELHPSKPGDIVFFDSFVPHRSQKNNTSKGRRVLYITYNKESEGDYYEQYYIDKRKTLPPDCEREPGKEYKYLI